MVTMKRILVIDDDKPFCDTMLAALRDQGFDALATEDGVAGLETARAQLPDLVICDVNLPQRSGLEVLTALRNDPAIATTPFILMTGDTEATPMRKGMRLGADDYLSKPFPLSDLIEAVKTQLQKRQQIHDLAEARVNELRSNLSLSLPHELLTPLTGILGFADLIRLDYDSLEPRDILEMVNNIHKCGHRLSRLIHNYLIFAEIQYLAPDSVRAQTFRAARTHASHSIVESTAKLCAQKCWRSGDLRLDLAEIPVAMSEEYFRKIVEELVENAFKFSPADTPVGVKTWASPAGFFLAVRDQGRGMTPLQITQVGAYQQFNRGHYQQHGIGLGLAIALRLVELHGGTLTVQSEVSAGTTVEVQLLT